MSSFAKVLNGLEDAEIRSEIDRLNRRNKFLKESLLRNPDDLMFLKELDNNTKKSATLYKRLTQEDRELRNAVRRLVETVKKTQKARGASLASRSQSKSGGKRKSSKTRKNRKA